MHPFPSSESPVVENTFTEIDADLNTPESPLSEWYADHADEIGNKELQPRG